MQNSPLTPIFSKEVEPREVKALFFRRKSVTFLVRLKDISILKKMKTVLLFSCN